MGTPFVPFDSYELTNNLREKARIELHEEEESRSQKVQELKNRLSEEKDLIFPDDDDFLLQFLRSRKFDVQRAFLLCTNFFKSFNNRVWRTIQFSIVDFLTDGIVLGCLPYRDNEGCLLYYLHAGSWIPEKIPSFGMFQLTLIMHAHAAQFPALHISGLKVIINFSGFGMKHLFAIRPLLFKQYIDSLNNSLPGRYKGIHFIYGSGLFAKLWAILGPLFSKKWRSRFHFHGNNLKELHEKFPPAILPEELGGELGPFENKCYRKYLIEFENDFNEMMTYGYKVDK